MSEKTSQPEEDEEYPDFIRTNCDMECKVCGKPYWKHPHHPKWSCLRVRCDGKLLKL